VHALDQNDQKTHRSNLQGVLNADSVVKSKRAPPEMPVLFLGDATLEFGRAISTLSINLSSSKQPRIACGSKSDCAEMVCSVWSRHQTRQRGLPWSSSPLNLLSVWVRALGALGSPSRSCPRKEAMTPGEEAWTSYLENVSLQLNSVSSFCVAFSSSLVPYWFGAGLRLSCSRYSLVGRPTMSGSL